MTVKGLDTLLRDLKAFDPKAIVAKKLEDIGNEILQNAVANAPSRASELKNSAKTIVRFEDDSFIVTIQFTAEYAAYVEFGTGDYVDVPSGLEEYAMTFYVNGEGTTRPQPFLFPAYFKKLPTILTDIENAIKSEQIFKR